MHNDNANPSETQDSLRQSNEIVTSWRDLDTSTPEGSRVLDRVIATWLGWRFECTAASGDVSWYRVTNANGEIVKRPLLTGTFGDDWPHYQIEETYPRYTTDANAALALLVKPVTALRLGPLCGGWVATIEVNYFYSYGQAAFEEPLATPALAICDAWLQWQDAQAAAAGGKREAGE